MEFNRETIKEIHDAINMALEDVADSYNITIKTGTLTYDPSTNTFTCPIKGSGDDAKRLVWNKNCHKFGFNPDDFGKSVLLQNKMYTIVGINPRAKTKPILITRDSDNMNTEYKANHRYILRELRAKEARS